MEKKKKMSKEAFKEVIDNIELINNITLYGRIGIKQNVKKLWAEIENLKADLYEANNIISDYIDVTAKQNKMIDKMIGMLEDYGADEFICNEVSKTLYKNNEICSENCKECIKQYFEKKAEESE